MKNNKNLIYIRFVDRENTELINCLNDLKKDYNFELESHKISDEFSPKTDFNRRMFIINVDKEDDVKKLQTEHEKHLDKVKNDYVILAAPFDVSKHLSTFNAKSWINIKDLQVCKSELRKILDREFKSVGMGQPSGKEQPVISGQQKSSTEYQTR